MALVTLAVLCARAAYAQCDTILFNDFNQWDNRRYTIADAKSDFNNQIKPWTASTYRGISAPGAAAELIEDVPQETRIVDGTLRAEYKANEASGRAGGFLFDPYFEGVEEAYVQYRMKFDEDFFWATGGKLPGLGGSRLGIGSETEARGAIPSGCRYNDDGFSARMMWRRNRAQTNDPYFILYSYFAEKPDGTDRLDGDCGDNYRVFTGLEADNWYTIRQYIKLNTPGERDGMVVIWIDDVEVFRKEDALIRKAGKDDLKINALIMHTYRGGARTDEVWHSPRDEFAFFDDVIVWTGDLGCVGVNQVPSVSFTTPANLATYEVGADVEVSVTAADADGTVDSVQLYLNDTLVRTISEAPYTWGGAQSGDTRLQGMSNGAYSLRAVAYDDVQGTNATTISVLVGEVATAPTTSFSTPANGAEYQAGDSIIVNVLASDPNGEIDRVSLYLNGEFLRAERVAPYEWGHRGDLDADLKDMAAGTYVIRVVAEDMDGEMAEEEITVTVVGSSSVREALAAQVGLAPTATRDRVTLTVPEAFVGERYAVLDVTGRVVVTDEVRGVREEIIVGGLARGLYVVEVAGVSRRFMRL